MNKPEMTMSEVMQYMAWIMFNGFDYEEKRKEEDLIPINGDKITSKRGVVLLVKSFER